MDEIKGQLKGICFFVTSTFGNGTHPTSAANTAEWLDTKLNDCEENVNERLNTIIQTQAAIEGGEAGNGGIDKIIEESESSTEHPQRKGRKGIPPLNKRQSSMILGKLPSRKSSITDQGKRKIVKTLSRRINMTTITPVTTEFSKLR